MKLIILDRDGVINFDNKDYIKSADEWQAIPGSLEAIARLQHAGHTVVIATNQSGIGRGYYSHADLDAIHEKMQRFLHKLNANIDAIFYCPHTPDDNCSCRKPKPGLLQQIQKRYQCSLQAVPLIGDSQRDLEAAISVDALPILVRTGNGEKTLAQFKPAKPLAVYANLSEAADALLAQSHGS